MRAISLPVLLLATLFAGSLQAAQLQVPPAAQTVLQKIYLFDLDAAVADAKAMQAQQPDHPLGYLLEAEAHWWQTGCEALEYRYGFTDFHRRGKLPADESFLELAKKITALSEARLKQQETAEMHFYAAMGEAMSARMYGLRGENRATARAGVRAREHFLKAIEFDSNFADADFGLGLYNYYVDTLGSIAKMLRFFMGIPGGDKNEGIRLLEVAKDRGTITPTIASYYLALNLLKFDQQYERALAIITPLAAKYPSNPYFLLLQGDCYAKLARNTQAAACYRAVAGLQLSSPQCTRHVHELARLSLEAIGAQHPAQ